MHIITQMSLFREDNLGDLKELYEVVDNLPYLELIYTLDQERAEGGRQTYSNLSMFKAYIAKILFGHDSINSLIRELNRNIQLRAFCDYEPWVDSNGKKHLAPSPSAFSRFLDRLSKHEDLVRKIFDKLVLEIAEEIDDFGNILAVDGKVIESYASPKSNKETEKLKREKVDRRRETDANFTAKKIHHKDGTTRTVYMYGFKVHIICDAKYELPVHFKVTPAGNPEGEVFREIFIDLPPLIMTRCDYVLADKGYDATVNYELIEEYGATAIIAKRKMWRDDVDGTRQYRNTQLIYNEKGEVFYETGEHNVEPIKLRYYGYDNSTDTLRYKFPVWIDNNKIFRIDRSEDIRIFTKVARDSIKFKNLYKKRTSVERLNGRLDRDYKFENHTIRGISKMRINVTLSLSVMLAIKLAELRSKEKDIGVAA